MSIEKPKAQIGPQDEAPTVPRFPEVEQHIERIFERNPHAAARKETLLAILNSDPFREDLMTKSIASWNEHEDATKTATRLDQGGEIEKVKGKHGTLRVSHFLASDRVKFIFNPN